MHDLRFTYYLFSYATKSQCFQVEVIRLCSVCSKLPCASVSKRVLVQYRSYVNEFYFHENKPEKNTFSCEWFWIKTRFDTEATWKSPITEFSKGSRREFRFVTPTLLAKFQSPFGPNFTSFPYSIHS